MWANIGEPDQTPDSDVASDLVLHLLPMYHKMDVMFIKHKCCGWSLAVTSSGPHGCVYGFSMSGSTRRLAGSGSCLKRLRKWGHGLVSSDRLMEPGIELRTPWYKANNPLHHAYVRLIWVEQWLQTEAYTCSCETFSFGDISNSLLKKSYTRIFLRFDV